MDGKNLKKLRNKMGWSLRELERRSGISKSLIADIEANKANPSVKTLQKLADAFGKTIEEVFFKNGN